MFFHSSSSTSNMSLAAIECLIPTWDVRANLIFALLLPFGFVILAMVSVGIAKTYRSVRHNIATEFVLYLHLHGYQMILTSCLVVRQTYRHAQ